MKAAILTYLKYNVGRAKTKSQTLKYFFRGFVLQNRDA
jgi:hypothetical protein